MHGVIVGADLYRARSWPLMILVGFFQLRIFSNTQETANQRQGDPTSMRGFLPWVCILYSLLTRHCLDLVSRLEKICLPHGILYLLESLENNTADSQEPSPGK